VKIGPVTITRDSALLWLGVLAGILTYLQHQTRIDTWGYDQWMSALGMAVTGLMLKLQTSSLPSKEDVAKLGGRALMVLALLGSISATGCSLLTGNARHTGVVVETGIAKSLFAVQDLAKESAVSFPDVMTPERFKEFNKAFVPVLELGLQVNRTVRTWPVGQPAPVELSSLVTQLKTLSDTALKTLPPGDVKTKLSAAVKIALDAALAVFNSLPHGGTPNEVVHSPVLAPVGG
jgi:hypothetical protein